MKEKNIIKFKKNPFFIINWYVFITHIHTHGRILCRFSSLPFFLPLCVCIYICFLSLGRHLKWDCYHPTIFQELQSVETFGVCLKYVPTSLSCNCSCSCGCSCKSWLLPSFLFEEEMEKGNTELPRLKEKKNNKKKKSASAVLKREK